MLYSLERNRAGSLCILKSAGAAGHPSTAASGTAVHHAWTISSLLSLAVRPDPMARSHHCPPQGHQGQGPGQQIPDSWSTLAANSGQGQILTRRWKRRHGLHP